MIHPKVINYISYGSAGPMHSGVFDGRTVDQGFTADAVGARAPLPVPITVTGLSLFCATAGHPQITLSILRNYTDSFGSLTLGAGVLTPVSVDTLSAFFAAGEDICYRIAYLGGAQPSPGFPIGVCVTYEQADGIQVFSIAAAGGSIGVGDGYRGGAFGNGQPGGDAFGLPADSNTFSIAAIRGAVTHLALRDFSVADPGASSWKAYLYKNNVRQVTTETVLTGTAKDIIHTLAAPVAFTPPDIGDVGFYRFGSNASFELANVTIGIGFRPTTPGEFMLCGGSNDTISNADVSWKWNTSEQLALLEGQHTAPIGPGGALARGLYIMHEAGVGAEWIHALRKNYANTAIVVSISDTEPNDVFFADVAYEEGDLISLQIEPIDSPGSNQLHWGLALLEEPTLGTIGPLVWVEIPNPL